MGITASFKDKQTIHGTLVRVGGDGILFLGEPGTGKSTAALELLLAGHILIADDVVHVVRKRDKLIGSAPKRLKGMLSVPKLGIFDVRDVLGAGCFAKSATIERCFEFGVVTGGRDRSILGVSLPTSPRMFLESDSGRVSLTRLDQSAIKRSEACFIEAHDRLVAS